MPPDIAKLRDIGEFSLSLVGQIFLWLNQLNLILNLSLFLSTSVDFDLHSNQLTGTFPFSACSLSPWAFVWVDFDKVTCNCGSKCVCV